MVCAWVLFFSLMGIGVYMICWGLKAPHGIVQFPTLAGASWVIFFGPEILGVLRNPSLAPQGALADNGIEMALLMCILCASLSFIGYLKGPSKHLRCMLQRRAKRIPFYHRRLFLAGFILIMISLIGFHKLAALCGGYQSYFSPEGNYALTWEGLPVAYVFFVMLVYPGLVFCFLATYQRPSFLRWIVIGVGLTIPILRVIILGRRTDFMVIGVTILFTRFFIYKRLPPRIIMIGCMVGAFIWVVIAPEYRTDTAIYGNYEKITKIDIFESVSMLFSGNEKSRNHFLINTYEIPAVHKEMAFGLGRNIYNAIIYKCVPALFVGRDLKNSLFIDVPDIKMITWKYYRRVRKYGSFITGPNGAFQEFWFFGAGLFFFIGMGFRALWILAFENKDSRAIIFYIVWAPQSVLSVIRGVHGVVTDILFFLLLTAPFLAWIFSKPSSKINYRYANNLLTIKKNN
jgi:hypothetical protein